MTYEKLYIKVLNAIYRIKRYFKPADCCSHFKNADGRLVDCEDWIGYQDCMYPGCGHYYIEHGFGGSSALLYVKPELTKHQWAIDGQGGVCTFCNTAMTDANMNDECPNTLKKGDTVTDPMGCLNAGCDMCPKFWTKEDLHDFVQQLSVARNHASHWFHLDECPGVLGSYARVTTIVEVDVTMRYPCTPEEYATMMDKSRELQAKFPHIAFNFHVQFESRKEPEE